MVMFVVGRSWKQLLASILLQEWRRRERYDI